MSRKHYLIQFLFIPLVMIVNFYTIPTGSLNGKRRGIGIYEVRWIKTTFPVPHPVSIVHFIMIAFQEITCQHVDTIQSLGR